MFTKYHLNMLLNYFITRTCITCGLNSQQLYLDLCNYCKEALPWQQFACYHCGLKLQDNKESVICNKCQNNLPPFNRVCALFDYIVPIPGMVTAIKFGKKLNTAYVLGHLLTDAIKTRWYKNQSLPEVIIPMPLHLKRLQQRGYNQALEIAKPISACLKIPLDVTTCQRKKYTKPQSKLAKAVRLKNLTAAFKVLPNKYQHIALLDDVITTGSTVRSVCKVLVASGITCVDIWCVARA